jgi:hypothetical protein
VAVPRRPSINPATCTLIPGHHPSPRTGLCGLG